MRGLCKHMAGGGGGDVLINGVLAARSETSSPGEAYRQPFQLNQLLMGKQPHGLEPSQMRLLLFEFSHRMPRECPTTFTMGKHSPDDSTSEALIDANCVYLERRRK